MKNPWLEIPLSDYEGHMELPQIGQADMLAQELASAVREHSPASVAVIGCAGGNGFDRLQRSGVERIVGIDINPEYVETTRHRYAKHFRALELYVADIQESVPMCAPVNLLYAGLIFEYVDVPAAMRVLRTLCTDRGMLVVVLQAAATHVATVSPSPYDSLQLLAPVLKLRVPAYLQECAANAGFSLESSRRVGLPSSKSFVVMSFRG
jgi:Methyltransferase domain